MPLIKGVPDYALYAGGGVVVGGGYLLYKRRKAAASSAASPSGSVSTAATGAITPDYSQQQSSIAPYYLTGTSGQDWRSQGGNGITQGPPLPVPSGPAGGTPVATTAQPLPNIPDILPAAPTPNPPAPVAVPPTAPAPAAQNNNIPADLLAKITANGERIVSSLAAPNGGVWYLGSKGGVFAINAPFYGAPAGQSYWGSRTGLQIVPNGSGYSVIDTAGERYTYGG